MPTAHQDLRKTISLLREAHASSAHWRKISAKWLTSTISNGYALLTAALQSCVGPTLTAADEEVRFLWIQL